MSKNTIIGIDLGTVNSAVAVMENGKYKVIENSEGARTTPSMVAYSPNEILVGASAKRQAVTNPKNTVYSIKRLMGQRYDSSEVTRQKTLVPYDIIESTNGDAWVKVNDKEESPPAISAQILMKMKKTAEDYLGRPVTEAVITVPAYFDNSQREATKVAGKIAGLEVKRIINEPTAAALAYGVDKNEKRDRKIAVFDFGGGTMDMSIIQLSYVEGEGQFEVLATHGDTHLGGEDIDNALMTFVISEFKKSQAVDLSKDMLAIQRLKDACEKAKIELSSSQQTEINLPYITATSAGPMHLTQTVTRSKFESLIDSFVGKTIDCAKIAMEEAALTTSDIAEVLLVGGSTRIPMVQQKVTTFFGKEPRKDVNPDEAVAAGAAIQGGVLQGDVTDVLLLDVTPLSLGLETMGGVMTRLIEKNSAIPTSKSQVFSTAADNQPSVTIHVLQGERQVVSGNKSLGQFNLDGIEPARQGVPQIEVTFDIDANGIITVKAKDKKTGKDSHITITGGSGLSQEEIDRMVEDAKANAESDKKTVELVQSRNTADMMVHQVKTQLDEVKDTAPADLQTSVTEKITAVEEAIKGSNKEAIDDAIKSLMETANKLSEHKKVEPAAEPNVEPSATETVVDADFAESK